MMERTEHMLAHPYYLYGYQDAREQIVNTLFQEVLHLREHNLISEAYRLEYFITKIDGENK